MIQRFAQYPTRDTTRSVSSSKYLGMLPNSRSPNARTPRISSPPMCKTSWQWRSARPRTAMRLAERARYPRCAPRGDQDRYPREYRPARALPLPSVAIRQHVTPRYVQMLFESEGTTFSEFVLDKRLAHARRMLRDPRYRHTGRSAKSPTKLASATSPISIAHFRRRFDATPSDVRAVAWGEADNTLV